VDDELNPDFTTWLLSRLGQPVPCELCRTETARADLREITVPGAVVVGERVGLDFVVSRVVWICRRCPG
jgi:hypothetical protein